MENTVSSTVTGTNTVIPMKVRDKSDHNRVIQISLYTGEIIYTFGSPYKASEVVNHSCKRIKMVCRGTLKKAGGYFWCYESPELQTQYSVTPESYKGE